jgi:hypothetical protein
MSDYIKATNFYAKDALLTGNPDKLIKGAEIDAEYNAISTAVATKANLNSPNFTGTPTVPTAPANTNTTQAASTAFVLAYGVPSGVILLWSGSSGTIPSGWYLCDGTNGTPNLVNRFVVGATSTYAVGATGGSADAIVVEHTHTGTTANKSLTGRFDIRTSILGNPFVYSDTGIVDIDDNGGINVSSFVTDTTQVDSSRVSFNASHDHTFTTASTGSSATNANLPPYYALCYIMKA